MKKIFLFVSLACAAVAQVTIDLRDVDWPSQSAKQLFRRNAANTGFEFFTASPQLTLSGDATGSATFTDLTNATLALTLANSGVSAGTFGSATQSITFTVDAKGRVNAASAQTVTPAFSSITGKPTTLGGYGITDAEPAITAGTTAQYRRGDKTWQTLDKTAVGLGSVDNTADTAKPVSTATQTALNAKADLASPAFTGTPLAPTAAAATNTTQLATTAFVIAERTNTATETNKDLSSSTNTYRSATTSTSGAVTLSDNATNLAGTSTTTANTPASWSYATSAVRNALAPRGGVAFDGTSSSRITSTLTGQNIGTDPFSLSVMLQVPTSNPSARAGIIGIFPTADGSGANSFYAAINSNGTINVQIASASGHYEFSAPLLANYAGKTVHLVFVRNAGGTLTYYVNAIAQTFSASGNVLTDWSQTQTSTYLIVGAIAAGSTTTATMKCFSASLYNCALDSASVHGIYELGGAVPELFKFGSQSILVSDYSAGTGGAAATNGTVAGNIDSIGGRDDNLRYYADATNSQHAILLTASGSLVERGLYRLKSLDVYLPSANTNAKHIWVQIGAAGVDGNEVGGYTRSAPLTTNDTWVTLSGSVTVANTVSASERRLVVNLGNAATANWSFAGANSVTDDIIYIRNVVLQRLGAVLHLPLDDGLGSQLRDASTNGLHAERTVTGTSWTSARQTGRQTLTYTFAHSAISSTAATTTAFLLPPNTVLREVQLNRTAAFDASTTLDLGISGTATKFVTATGVAGTGFVQVASSSLVPESASAWTTVYVKKNQATTTGSVTLNFIIEAVGSPTQ